MSKRPRSSPERQSAPNPLLEQAVAAFGRGRPDEAERLAAGVLKSERGNVRAAQVLGHALMLQGRPAEAMEPLQRAAGRGKDAATETLLARALAAVGRNDEALAQLAAATARRPVHPLAFLEQGDLLGRLARFDEAIAAFEAGLALAPEAHVLRIGLGYIHLKRNDRARARALFAAVRAAAPQRPDAVIGLAKVTASEGDYAAAADLYRQVLAAQPGDSATRLDLAKCLLELGQRDAGEAMLRTVTRGAPSAGGPALLALTATPHGRFFLKRSAAEAFLGT